MRQSQRQSMLLMRVLYWAATSWLFTHIHSKRSWWIANDTDLFSKLWMDSQRQLDRRSWRRSLARSFAKFRKLMLTSITPTAISRQMQHMTRPVTFVRKIGWRLTIWSFRQQQEENRTKKNGSKGGIYVQEQKAKVHLVGSGTEPGIVDRAAVP